MTDDEIDALERWISESIEPFASLPSPSMVSDNISPLGGWRRQLYILDEPRWSARPWASDETANALLVDKILTAYRYFAVCYDANYCDANAKTTEFEAFTSTDPSFKAFAIVLNETDRLLANCLAYRTAKEQPYKAWKKRP